MLRRGIGELAAKVAAWATSSRTVTGSSGPALAPLTPEFDATQHQVYVDHLNAAIEDPRVRNIALTGRYGSGKSSILEQFARQPTTEKQVLSLALSTLGPEPLDDSGVEKRTSAGSTTNRIEKELVKQLLHREKPSRLRQSRYQRIEVLPMWRAVFEAIVIVSAVAVVLWALGVFPSVPGGSDEYSWPVRVGAVVAIGGAPVALVAWVRLAVHNRFAISELSAGGASISLTRAGSYFDEYLDEIVYFFETARDVQIVLFEDLDRFDDPGIFEALRELNTLLNNSKQMGNRTIRFVYALRDSVFEKLGRDGTEDPDDAAHAEATRANRTKFFDLVITIVPFITHRNARDLLTQVLQDERHGAVVPVSPELVDLTARYLPDMRLLRNIRNEYSVFAQRLITEQRGVRSLRADQLFALIVYKNIHLADFEDLLLGRSKLDELYRFSRQLVTEAMGVRRARLRELADEVALPQALNKRTERWGEQLSWYVEEVRKAKAAVRAYSYTLTGFEVHGTEFDASKVGDVEFWQAVGAAGTGLTVRFDRQGNPDPFQIDMAGVGRLLSDELPPGGWDSVERADLARVRSQIESEIDLLRTADFIELADHPQIKTSNELEQRSFSDVLASTVASELGRALISQGYIDRYYTLYVAQYYGDHVPPNAMNFIVQNVDTNRSDVNYPFADDDEIAAVLRETKRSFLTEKGAYNTAIVDYLFEHDVAGAKSVLDTASHELGDDERAFLDAYFADGSFTNAAATYLGSTWPLIFVYLVTDVDVTANSRLELVSAALAGASRDVTYEVNDAVRAYLQNNHPTLRVVTRNPAVSGLADDAISDEQVRNAVFVLDRAGVVFGELSTLSPIAVKLVVERDSYALTHANLRTILGKHVALSLDSIAAIDQGVYEDCLQRVDEYLAALSGDNTTTVAASEHVSSLGDVATEFVPNVGAVWTIESPSAFANVVADLVAHSGSVPVTVLSLAHPDCVVDDLTDVPTEAWLALAETRRVSPTLPNVDSYIQEIGDVDTGLAATLVLAGHIVRVPDEGDAEEGGETRDARSRVASAILQASGAIPDPATRVNLASSLGLGDWYALSNVTPEDGKLLGHLVAADIWSDEAAVIGHFVDPTWETLSFAIQRSGTFIEYMTPALLDHSMTTELLTSADINPEVKRAVLERFDDFVNVATRDALAAAGKAALATGTLLTTANIASIAAGTGDSDMVLRLLDAHGRSLGADEIVNTLAHLPSPYNQLAQSGAKLEFPRDDRHEAVLKRVKEAGLVSSRAHKASLFRGARIDVTVK